MTFRRIILKNNAKKRKTYELFIESVPLLKSLEVKPLKHLHQILVLALAPQSAFLLYQMSVSFLVRTKFEELLWNHVYCTT